MQSSTLGSLESYLNSRSTQDSISELYSIIDELRSRVDDFEDLLRTQTAVNVSLLDLNATNDDIIHKINELITQFNKTLR